MKQDNLIVGKFGYVQKSSRYFWKINEEIEMAQGFKSKKQCNEWLEIKYSDIDWRVGFLVKFKGLSNAWELVDRYGKIVKHGVI
jgi:hypothetical protein